MAMGRGDSSSVIVGEIHLFNALLFLHSNDVASSYRSSIKFV